ncbi:hypothetical protein PR202_gb14523 [Eleusine coracana subsp. coracana]|uniref:RRM domain-containing protein n=1 Tax=Eleusine coracana subsp. coracana TaxID=191504 RepID=A0AAV5EX07_ELECO|nr:hypothetical protein PR202_gb14523 [Eleusine coracana subsp. coracana]
MVLGSKHGRDGDHRLSLIRPARPTYPKPKPSKTGPEISNRGRIVNQSLPHPPPEAQQFPKFPAQLTHPVIPMALSLARSSAHPAAALAAPRVSQSAPALPFHSARRPYPRLRLRFPTAAVAASSPPDAAEAEGDQEQGRKAAEAVIKGKDGRNRGFAFITMSTAEEAAAAVEKLNASDVKGRTIKVEFSKGFRKPAQPALPVVERHKLYVSNLPWKARAPDLKEFFSKFNPLSARVVFNDKKSTGYGFVSFGTKDEAEAALTELDGKELLERPVRVRWREVDDKVEGVNTDSEVEAVNVEGARVDGSSDDGSEDKQE